MEKISLKELTKQIKKIAKVKENVYYKDLFKDKGKRVCLSFYYFGDISSFHCGIYLVYMFLDYNGKITGVQLGIKEPEDYQGLIGTTLDLTTLGKYKKQVHDGPKNFNMTKVLGEVTSNGTIRMFTKKDYLNPRVVDKQEVNDKLEEPDNKEYVELYRSFTKEFRKYLVDCKMTDDHGTKWVASFKIRGTNFSIELWLFFHYHFTITIYSRKGFRGLTLSDNKVDAKEFMAIVKEIISKKLSNITKVLCVTEKCGYDDRGYSFRSNEDEVEVDIKFRGDGEPRGKYTFKFDLNKKKVRCLDTKRSTKFIPEEVKRFRERLREMLR